ncbi:putative major facilitator superfamily transporter [Rickenella mellea]|uniref:Putative major facilitator superfamily transporter n=1 Tax=Rickenella mellea TaxID=50990 RepID=A0A4Y7QL11_9AGAM|nr:putative major facilitator superfamily transporter [Rickenella mellea]
MSNEDGDSRDEKAPAPSQAEAITVDEKRISKDVEPSTRSNDDAKPESGDAQATTTQTEEVEDESKYPSGFPLGILTAGLCMVTFVIALDNTIIATAIPTITTAFNSLGDVGWYGSSYLLTTTSLQPSFGRIYTYFNIKWTYLIALVIFELGSVICAAAKNSPMLIVGRAIAGVGAAALFSGGMTIIAFAVPLRKRAMYVACLSSMFGIASVVGPILGGALTDKVSWRWCFWINLPFGAIAFVTVLVFFKPPERPLNTLALKDKIKEIDIQGATFLICGIVCLLLALQWGGTKFPWHDSKVYGLIIGFGLLISVFIGLQLYRGDRATIPPRVLRQRTVLTCALYTCLLSMGLYTQIFYLPFYFQAVKGASAENSGIRTIPYLVSITLSSLIVGGSITVLGYYAPFMWIGSALYTVGSGLLFTLRVNSSAGTWIGYQILAGLGAGACVQIPFIAVQVVLSPTDIPSGNAIVIFFNSLGGSVAISIAQNIFATNLVKEVAKHTTGIDPQTILATGATHIREVVPASQLSGVLYAYDLAINKAFILPIAVGTATLIVGFFVEWKSVKGKNLMAGGAA